MPATEVASRKILAIRASAGNDCATCPACGRAASAPYARLHAGKIVEGCVDAAHTPHLQGVSCSASAWHFRPAAVAIRRAALDFLLAATKR